eukprot:scaffold3396_cov268-Ochromonas_danica.AAC.7
MKKTLEEILIASRPWSFTAMAIPVLITTAVTKSSFCSLSFLQAFFMGLFVHAGANLTNTYYDFCNGVDTKAHNHDPTLVDRRLTPSLLLTTAILCYTLAVIIVAPLFFDTYYQEMIFPFAIGLLLAFFYTANPIGLKYIAMGDITIFVCFGPLLMQCVSIILTGKMNSDLYLYTIPIGLLTEAILHANNARDIKADTAAGAVTLASLIGFDMSYYFFIFLIVGAYVSVALIALFYHYGCLLSLLTIPLGYDLIKRFNDPIQMKELTASSLISLELSGLTSEEGEE